MDNLDLDRAKKVMVEILVEIDDICNRNKINYWLDLGTLLGAIRHKGFIPWDDDIDITMPRKDYNNFIQIVEKELSSKYFLHTNRTDKNCYSDWIKIRDKKSIYIEFGDKENHVSTNSGIFVDIFPLDRISIKNIKIFNFLRKAFQINPFKSVFKSVKKRLLHYLLSPTYFFRKKIFKISKNITNSSGDIAIFGVETWVSYNFEHELIYPLKKIEFEGLMFNAPNNCDKILQSYYGDYMKLPAIKDRQVHAKRIKFLE